MKNNNEKFENFIRDFDTIRMTNSEKNKIQNNLSFFANNYSNTQSPYFSHISFFKKTLSVAIILFLVISISKPASASSLPGDILYNIKIIHEEIKAATITEPEKKVNFNIERTETRIKEAVNLAKKKRLDKKTQGEIAKTIQKHVKDIKKELEEVKKENPEKALSLNSELKTSLKVSVKVLKKVTKNNEKVITKKVRKNKKVILDSKQKKNKDNTTQGIKDKINNIQKKELTEETNLISENVNNEENKEITDNITKNNLSKQEENIKIENTEEYDLTLNQINKENILEVPEPEEYININNILIQSIDIKIQETENISEIIEGEIIAKEEKENLENVLSNSEKKVENITSTNNTKNIEKGIDNQINLIQVQENINKEVIKINKENQEIEEIDLSLDKDDINILQEGNELSININVQETQESKDTTEIKQIKDETSEIIIKKENPFSIILKVKKEIDSMENIIEAEEQLRKLTNELLLIRDNLKINEIERLINEKHLGQAYIKIQKEIEILSEIKKTNEIEHDFGIKDQAKKQMTNEIMNINLTENLSL